MEDWCPDEGLVDRVRSIGAPIKGMSDEDRVWVVVSLLTAGFTAAFRNAKGIRPPGNPKYTGMKG